MTEKKIKTFVLNVGGKQKKIKVSESILNIYLGIISQNLLS